MDNSLDLDFESLRLQNRVGRLVDVELCCLRAEPDTLIIFRTDNAAAAALLTKSIEGFAFQLRQRLTIDGNRLELLHLHEIEDDARCVRWKFTWAGTSPVKPISQEVPVAILQKALQEKNYSTIKLSNKNSVADVA